MDKLWWNHIIRAHKFIEDIVSALLEGKSILLSLPNNVPWKNTLIEIISERLQAENPKNSFDRVKCPKEEAGFFLLNKYCKEERRATYRYGMTYASFLGKCEDTVLNDRYVWIDHVPADKIEEWVSFITEYNKNVKNKTPGAFILETYEEIDKYKVKKGIKRFVFGQNIGSYDKFAFCTLAATENSYKEYMRPYLAELVASICSDDIELCAECVRVGEEYVQHPIKVIESIIECKYRSDGGRYSFDKSEEQVKQAIWETQLKYIFPLVEKYRNYFINQYALQIEPALPITTFYGVVVHNLQDVEIGMLIYMTGNGTISICPTEYKRLELFKEARNKLAHLNILSFEDVDKILRSKVEEFDS